MARLRRCELPLPGVCNLHEIIGASIRRLTLATCLPALLFAVVLGAFQIDAGAGAVPRGFIQFSDRSGLPLGVVLPSERNRTAYVPLRDVSPNFLQAVVAVEDARFYRHPGVDLFAVARAVRQLVENGKAVSGASTITMQLARMRAGLPGTPRGKLLETWDALRLEAGSGKDAILEAYVNRLPMGGNVYGVEAAAQTYFGEPAADLDLAQAALLAAIPNDPVRLDPHAHWQALKKRRRFVLERMRARGVINAVQEDRAVAEAVALHPPVRGILAGAHFVFALAAQTPPGITRVQTTLDRPLQQFVETQLRALLAALAPQNVHQGAAVVVDNRSGDILAYVGSPDYFDDAQRGRNDGVRALRQPGSALKPFLYELALERGAIAPNTILADVPVAYAIPGGRLYAPSDYSNAYMGPVRVRSALANSLNVPAVRVLAQVGAPAFLDRLHELGFLHLDRSAAYYGLGLTLGGGEVSLLELARAYVTMARGGSSIPLRMTPDESAAPPLQTGSRRLWLLVTDMLADRHARAHSFGVHSILDAPFDAAVKTGTSSDFRDTWTAGFTRDYTVAVWVGNFDGKPMRRVSGVTGAAPLWNRIMLHLHEKAEPQPFAPPPGMMRRAICATTGWRPRANCPAVVSEYLFASQLARYEHPASGTLPRSYDAWIAAQNEPARVPADVRILFPHDGDTFMLNRTDDGVQIAAPQAIAFRMRTARNARVTWELNGKRIAADANVLPWPLRVGTWRLIAVSGSRRDAVSFRVVSAAPLRRRGFTF